jgi:hypothetical protein
MFATNIWAALREFERFDTQATARANVRAAIERAASRQYADGLPKVLHSPGNPEGLSRWRPVPVANEADLNADQRKRHRNEA